ncbi:MAG TPA: translation initiation factor IF-2 N-terminal domain-containing protein, partial [Myxococcota bacterium]|nr:translation initiation factor IF-2 N-terminal domain-containing protein [Myxococcota bacterium]
MGKLRVHELARKLNMSNQDVIAMLNAKGVLVRTHSSSVDEAEAYRALGLSPSGESLKVMHRPRTVLRKRREHEGVPGESVGDELLGQHVEPSAEPIEHKKKEVAPSIAEIPEMPP